MPRRFILIAWTALIAGCAQPQRGAVISAAPPHVVRANLVFARHPGTAALAPAIAARSDWPATDHGYRFDDVTYYSRIFYDEQSFYGRYGALWHEADTFVTGVWRR